MPTIPPIATGPDPSESASATEALHARYGRVRRQTECLCTPLQTEDYVAQSMADASPVKWHLGHTSWFFETFVLQPATACRPYHPQFGYLFNSYYNAVGERVPRPRRGLLTRPTVQEVFEYREWVDRRMEELLEQHDAPDLPALAPLVELGLHHEQQHQELILTDVKHLFAANPLRPAYRAAEPPARGQAGTAHWIEFPAGLNWVGAPDAGFAFDNERPRHRVFVNAFAVASRLVTAGEYLAFIEDGGYERPELWLSDGWDVCQAQGWTAPLYWERHDRRWWVTTLSGTRPADPPEPVCHVSFYEADAFARWAGARLPTEAEWESAAAARPVRGNLLEEGLFHPRPLDGRGGDAVPAQIFGDVWEWTQSAYLAYPGYRPAPGALGEYNAKFMCNQLVLRGGSCATPKSHIRASYRNFFPAGTRWQFSGIRLARDVAG